MPWRKQPATGRRSIVHSDHAPQRATGISASTSTTASKTVRTEPNAEDGHHGERVVGGVACAAVLVTAVGRG